MNFVMLLLDTNFANEESENNPIIDLDANSVESPSYFQPSSPSYRYWIDLAPPFNPKPLHTSDDGNLATS